MKRITASVIALMSLASGCSAPKKAEAAKSSTAPAAVEPPPAYRVIFATTKGEFTIQVYRPWAPKGADRFYEMVHAKFYDGVRFHRVIRKSVAQFGINPDPKVNGMWRMLKIPDDEQVHKNTRGTVAFAMNGANTRSTQVFINLSDNTRLDAQGFVPFGEVVDGIENVDKLTAIYGDMAPLGAGPNPTKIELVGNSYLDREFPRLDGINTARVSLK
jgi:peptidyl-prolyl cis-trans isomerase A (cyclophilin A)